MAQLTETPAPLPTPRGRIIFLVVVVLAMQVTTRLLPPSEVPVSVCLVRNLTGLPCPSCGMSRGFHAMATWRPAQAFSFNIAAPLVYPASWLLLVIGLLDLTIRPGLLDRLWLRVKRPVLVVVLLLMAISWGLNLSEHFGQHTLGESLAGSWPGRLTGLIVDAVRTLLR